jgi:molybdopterin/thiamine biosynthesis adenylyltransferase
MGEVAMKLPITVRIEEGLFQRLFAHLFPGDRDEHGAVLAAGLQMSERGTRLLVRDVFPARDGVDYVPGQRGYRALTPRFVAERSDHCARENLCYLAVHCHRGEDTVAFSPDDLASHQRGYPALLDITRGAPVGALVFARNAVAGEIWTRHGKFPLARLTVIGPRVKSLYPRPQERPPHANPVYDRHARLFGDAGQEILRHLKVGIIGLGGGGSLINEWGSRLGIGHIVAVDFDKLTPSNIPRVVGATHWDAMTLLASSRFAWVRKLGWMLARYKVDVARRVARQGNPTIRYEAVRGSVLDEDVARRLADADFLFLAGDTIQSRLVFNALVQQYLIPGAQVGVKVMIDRANRRVEEILAATRLVLPGPGGGCLHCHELIPPGRLQEEALTPTERRAQRYLDDEEVTEPSVITLNALSVAPAVNDLMMMFTGLFRDGVDLGHRLNFPRERTLSAVEPRIDSLCLDCGDHARSRHAMGDRARLPCRRSSR